MTVLQVVSGYEHEIERLKKENETLKQRGKMLETVIDLHVKGIDAREEDMKRKNETIEALKEIIRDLRNFINKASKELEG